MIETLIFIVSLVIYLAIETRKEIRNHEQETREYEKEERHHVTKE